MSTWLIWWPLPTLWLALGLSEGVGAVSVWWLMQLKHALLEGMLTELSACTICVAEHSRPHAHRSAQVLRCCDACSDMRGRGCLLPRSLLWPLG